MYVCYIIWTDRKLHLNCWVSCDSASSLTRDQIETKHPYVSVGIFPRKTFQKYSKYSKILKKYSRYLKYSKIIKNIPKYSKMFENIPEIQDMNAAIKS